MGKRWAAVLLAAMLMLSAAACMAPESGPPSAVSSADSADSAQGTAAPDDSASVPDAPTTAPADPEASDSAENAEKNDLFRRIAPICSSLRVSVPNRSGIFHTDCPAQR